MSGNIHVKIVDGALSCEEALRFAEQDAHGAVSLFIGRVRNHHEGERVESVTYDVFAPLAEACLRQLGEEARARWGDDLSVWVEHARGRLAVGEASVVIAVSAAHRDEAFQACRFLIEEIKRRAPVWKEEHPANGPSVWLPGQSLRTREDPDDASSRVA